MDFLLPPFLSITSTILAVSFCFSFLSDLRLLPLAAIFLLQSSSTFLSVVTYLMFIRLSALLGSLGTIGSMFSSSLPRSRTISLTQTVGSSHTTEPNMNWPGPLGCFPGMNLQMFRMYPYTRAVLYYQVRNLGRRVCRCDNFELGLK